MKTLWEICTSEYFPLNLKITSSETTRQYGIALKSYERFLGHPPTRDDLQDDLITIWMGTMLRGDPALGIEPLSPNTVRERAGRLRALWEWLWRRGVLPRGPAFRKPTAPDPQPLALSRDELQRLFRSAGKERDFIDGIPADLWWRSYLGFVFSTSERKTAALSVRMEWVNVEAGWCSIPARNRKGGKKGRTYKFWSNYLPLLKKVLSVQPQRELVWPWPYCPGAYYTRYNRILRDAAIPVDRRHKTHALRVSHGTWTEAFGGDPTKALGHSDVATYMRHYRDERFLERGNPELFSPWDET